MVAEPARFVFNITIMSIFQFQPYQKRPVRFVELFPCHDWQIKLYSISNQNEFVSSSHINKAKQCVSDWLNDACNYPLTSYKIATLILHEGKEGCFAIISWWIDENMLQLHVYLQSYDDTSSFQRYSDQGMVSCVWELAVLWFERNAWIEHILKKPAEPDFISYLQQQMNEDV